jgi:hypothetical protein
MIDPKLYYYSFSEAAREKAIRDILDEVKRVTGASEEEVLLALAMCANKIMDINGFELE